MPWMRRRNSVEIAPECYDTSVMSFEVIGNIEEIETFAVGSSIREAPRLRRICGTGRWRKRKGIARLRLEDGSLCTADVH
jgi:hypothetical protein